MIETTYLIRCDGCGTHLGADDEELGLAYRFDTALDAWSAARASGWGTTGHRHYCPGCWASKTSERAVLSGG